ncbi:MAG TPA: ClbS/DfsB family four-helix bundle protein [Anaerolineales bacterium]|nr:ClbS/DfsB family four-helix bundle protein [Anaerolineales bacterium]
MTKSEILSALDASRAALLDVIDGLPPERLLAPNAVGEWSVRDILQHLSLWEAELVRLLVHVDQRRKPVGAGLGASPDFDSLNARWHAETKDRPLENVLADFHGVRRQTRRWVEEFSEDELTRVRPEPWLQRRPLAVWIAEYSYEHEAEHIQAIRAWRQAAGG